jgi:hypothetical protein
MLTGSTAAGWHGAPRTTLDIDFVIDPAPAQLSTLLQNLERPGIYLSPEAAQEAVRVAGMFNVVDTTTGFKADLIMRKSRPFSRAEFDRRSRVELDGGEVWMIRLEDLILSKLERAQLSDSRRQIEDVASLLRVADQQVDEAHIRHWVDELELQSQHQAARDRASGH